MIYKLKLDFGNGDPVITIPVIGADLVGTDTQVNYARDLVYQYCNDTLIGIAFLEISENALKPFYGGNAYVAIAGYYSNYIQRNAAHVLAESDAGKIINALKNKIKNDLSRGLRCPPMDEEDGQPDE